MLLGITINSYANITVGDCLRQQVMLSSYEEEQGDINELEVDQEGVMRPLSENILSNDSLNRIFDGSEFQECSQLSDLEAFVFNLGKDYLNCPDVDEANCESFKAFIDSQSNQIRMKVDAGIINFSIQDIEKSLSDLERKIDNTELAQKIKDRHKEINELRSNDFTLINESQKKISKARNASLKGESERDVSKNDKEEISKEMKLNLFKEWLLGLWKNFLSLVIGIINFFTFNWN